MQLLKDLDLFETKTASFTPQNADGTPGEPPEDRRVLSSRSEEKLNVLPAEKFIELRDNGALAQIYAHLISLLGWDRLIAIALARQALAPRAGQQLDRRFFSQGGRKCNLVA